MSRADLAKETFRRPDEIEAVLVEALAAGELAMVGERFVDAERLEKGRQKLREALARFHEREPLAASVGRPFVREQVGVGDAVLDALLGGMEDVEKVEGGRLRLRDATPRLSSEQEERRDRIEAILLEERFTPPRESELPPLVSGNPAEAAKLVELLVSEGKVVRIGAGVLLHRDAVEEAKAAISEFVRQKGELAPADLKALLGMSRKYSIPMLEWMDAERFTVRRGDRRILG